MRILQPIFRGTCELSAGTAAALHLVDCELDVGRLMEAAGTMAGTKPGFASALTVTGLETLLRSLDEEARLSSLGTLFVKRKLIATIANRLRLESMQEARDGAIERTLHQPVFMAGLPRTGTTLLHRLLAEHDALRTLQLGEVLEPFSKDRRSRDRRAADIVRAIGLFAPDALGVHPMAVNAPAECHHLMEATFVSAFFVHFEVPGYAQWMLSLDVDALAEACGHYRQLVAGVTGGESRFLSKAPAHALYGAALPATFPGMWVIRTHRPAESAVPSLANLIALYRRMFSRDVSKEAVGRLALDVFRIGGKRMIDMDAGLYPDRAIDIDYAHLVADPVGTAMAVFERLGLDTTRAVEERLRRRHRTERIHANRSAYSPHQFGLTEAAIVTATRDYQDWVAGRTKL